MSEHLGEFPRPLFEQYTESKADLVSCSMNLGRALRRADGTSVDYWHKEIMRISADVEQLRAAIIGPKSNEPPADE